MAREKKNYRIERISPENIYDLIPLYRDVFGIKVTRQFIEKKYDTAYLGVGYYGHLAYDEQGKPTGYYGAIPFLIEWEGKKVIGAQSGDAMTHPDHAGQGLFTRLGNLTDDLLKKEGIEFVYGFPNQNSYYGYTKKLHWEHREDMSRFNLKVRTLPLEKLSRRLGWMRSWYLNYRDRVLRPYRSDARALDSSVISDGFGGTCRNEDFFRYKSFLGNAIYQIGPCKVWMKVEGGMLIGDMEQKSDTEMDQCVKLLQKLAWRLGVTEIILQFSPGSAPANYFSTRYPTLPSWAIGYKNYTSELPLDKLRFTYGDLDTF